MRQVRDLVSAYRVVTLTGPGGIGKTTLAIEAARGLLANFDGGGWFVELASLSDPDLVPSTVASALGLKLSGEDFRRGGRARRRRETTSAGARQLRARHRRGGRTWPRRFVRLCPRITILATSREVLRIDGEYVYRVPPLEVPALGQGTPDHILGHSAVELFIARTKALDVGLFAARRRPHGDCRDLPAARRHTARHRVRRGAAPPRSAFEQVAIGLRDRFALLTRGRRTALPRQRTLRATLDWSHELLPEAERLLLRRLAVFPAGFTLDAAVAVMTDTGLDAAAGDGRHRQSCHEIVGRAGQDLGRVTRWYLLETIRAYALEKLAEHGEADTAARTPCGVFSRFLRTAGVGRRIAVIGRGPDAPCSRDRQRSRGARLVLLLDRRPGDRRRSDGRLCAGLAAFVAGDGMPRALRARAARS